MEAEFESGIALMADLDAHAEVQVESLALVTADLVFVNGKLNEQTVTDSVTLEEPTTTVMSVGTEPRPSWYPNGYFIWPTYGTFTSGYGWRYIFGSTSWHSGIDIAAALTARPVGRRRRGQTCSFCRLQRKF